MVEPKQKPKEKELTEEEKMDLVEQNLADLDKLHGRKRRIFKTIKTAYPKVKGYAAFLFFHTSF